MKWGCRCRINAARAPLGSDCPNLEVIERCNVNVEYSTINLQFYRNIIHKIYLYNLVINLWLIIT